MKNFILFYAGLIFVLSGCSLSSDDPFGNIELKEGEQRLYFIKNNDNPIINIDTNAFVQEFQNFYIDNIDVLNSLQKNSIFEMTKDVGNINIYYTLLLKTNTKYYFIGWLDLKNNKLKRDKLYNFDFNKFITFKNAFKSLDFNTILLNSTKSARILIDSLEKYGGYIYGETGNNKKSIFDFEGIITISTNKFDINQYHEKDKLVDIIEKHLSKCGDFYLSSTNFTAPNNLKIKLYCNSEFSEKLPEGFSVYETFTDSVKLQIEVYGLIKELILEKANTIGINELSFVEE